MQVHLQASMIDASGQAMYKALAGLRNSMCAHGMQADSRAPFVARQSMHSSLHVTFLGTLLQVLRRGIAVEKDIEGNVVDARDEATLIDWHDGRNLLLKRVKLTRKAKVGRWCMSA